MVQQNFKAAIQKDFPGLGSNLFVGCDTDAALAVAFPKGMMMFPIEEMYFSMEGTHMSSEYCRMLDCLQNDTWLDAELNYQKVMQDITILGQKL